MASKTAEAGGNVKVCLRVRPMNELEKSKGGDTVFTFVDEITVRVGQNNEQYAFDRVFGPDTTQAEFFEFAAKNIADDVFKGYNGTVFAYGQTSCGKTHTMEGPSIDDKEKRGVIPRMISTVFDVIMNTEENIEFTVKVSMVEIYMEKIRDLLNPSQDNLPVHEDKIKGIYIGGVTEVYVSSLEEVMSVMKQGGNNRSTAATNMNAESSRSHSMTMLTVNQKNLTDLSNKSAKLFLVDLAGSEKISKTGASGKLLDEAKKINQSLLTLGNVINSLTDGKGGHIPYRDSKLTRVLQESIGGNSRTTLVICCSPSPFNEQETISTLRFGTRAKSIKNKAKVNQERSVQELKLLLVKSSKEIEQLQVYIAGLEDELKVFKSGGVVTTKSADGSTTNVDLANLPGVAVLQERYQEIEQKFQQKEEESQHMQMIQDTLLDQLSEKEAELEAALEEYASLKVEFETSDDTEKELIKENEILLTKLADLSFLHEKLQHDNTEKDFTIESLFNENESLQKEIKDMQTRKPNDFMVPHKGDTVQNLLQDWEKSKGEWTQKEEKLKSSIQASISEANRMEDSLMHPTSQTSSTTSTSKLEATKPAVPGKVVDGSISAKLGNGIEIPASTGNEKKIAAQPKLQSIEDALATPVSSGSSYPIEQVTKLETQVINLETQKQVLEHESEQLKAKIATLEDTLNQKSFESTTIQTAAMLGSIPSTPSDDETGKLHEEVTDKQKQVEKLLNEKQEDQWKLDKLQANFENRLKYYQQREEEYAKREEEVKKREKLEQELKNLKQQTAQQLSEFDTLKAALMRDLQNRCEKVIDLEMSLDESRDQYNQLLKNSSNKALQKKVIFLERNLEQLTSVHQQLNNQNNAFKLEIQVAEKKLVARNERIHNLEILLQDCQEKLQKQAQQHEDEVVHMKQQIENQVQEKKVVRAGTVPGSVNPAIVGSRIAKPIRGGRKTSTSIAVVDRVSVVVERQNSEIMDSPTPEAEEDDSTKNSSGSGGFWDFLSFKKANAGPSTPSPTTVKQPVPKSSTNTETPAEKTAS